MNKEKTAGIVLISTAALVGIYSLGKYIFKRRRKENRRRAAEKSKVKELESELMGIKGEKNSEILSMDMIAKICYLISKYGKAMHEEENKRQDKERRYCLHKGEKGKYEIMAKESVEYEEQCAEEVCLYILRRLSIDTLEFNTGVAYYSDRLDFKHMVDIFEDQGIRSHSHAHISTISLDIVQQINYYIEEIKKGGFGMELFENIREEEFIGKKAFLAAEVETALRNLYLADMIFLKFGIEESELKNAMRSYGMSPIATSILD